MGNNENWSKLHSLRELITFSGGGPTATISWSLRSQFKFKRMQWFRGKSGAVQDSSADCTKVRHLITNMYLDAWPIKVQAPLDLVASHVLQISKLKFPVCLISMACFAQQLLPILYKFQPPTSKLGPAIKLRPCAVKRDRPTSRPSLGMRKSPRWTRVKFWVQLVTRLLYFDG